MHPRKLYHNFINSFMSALVVEFEESLCSAIPSLLPGLMNAKEKFGFHPLLWYGLEGHLRTSSSCPELLKYSPSSSAVCLVSENMETFRCCTCFREFVCARLCAQGQRQYPEIHQYRVLSPCWSVITSLYVASTALFIVAAENFSLPSFSFKDSRPYRNSWNHIFTDAVD